MPNLLALTDDTLLQILGSGCDRRSPYEIIIGAPVLPAMIIGAADLVRLGLVARRFAAKAFSGPQQADTWSLASEAARRRVLAHDRADCVPASGFAGFVPRLPLAGVRPARLALAPSRVVGSVERGVYRKARHGARERPPAQPSAPRGARAARRAIAVVARGVPSERGAASGGFRRRWGCCGGVG